MPKDRPLTPEDHVQVDWGGDFAASYHAAFPDQPNAVVSISYGPLALEYILATGGSGYFRKGFVRSYLEEGRLALVPDSRSEEHTSELQSLMRISYAVFCLKKKKKYIFN